jgi:hypothetical protein
MESLSHSRWYVEASAERLRHSQSAAILGELVVRHHFDVSPKQREAWLQEVDSLKLLASAAPQCHFFLEFSIPRMGKRADAVLLAEGIVFILEYKVGANEYWQHALDQALDYALDLKNFHIGSHDRTIIPILIATDAPPVASRAEPWSDRVAKPLLANSQNLAALITAVLGELGSNVDEQEGGGASCHHLHSEHSSFSRRVCRKQ